MKKLSTIQQLKILFFCALLCSTYSIVNAQSGTIDNIFWSISDNILIINGKGDIPNYVKAPWIEHKNSFTSAIIGDGIRSIGYSNFSDCENLVSVSIPNSVTKIGDLSFSGCSGLTSLIIPNSVTIIGDFAFSGCDGLTSIMIPESVTHIGLGGISSKRMLDINVDINNPTYSSSEGILYNKDKSVLKKYPTGKEDNHYIIPETVKSIDFLAFADCENLRSVTISNSVNIIKVSAFGYCTNLTDITISNSVTSIGSRAFERCISLKEITNHAIIPQKINADVFDEMDISAVTLYVPAESVSTYRSAEVWKDIKNIKEIDASGR